MVVDQIRAATQDLLAALTPEQLKQISAPFDTPDHQTWTYLPGAVPGLALTDLSAAQEALVVRLLELVYSKRGLADFRAVMAAEIIVRGLGDPMEVAETGGWTGSTVGDRYYLRVLGDPAGTEPWAWRLNGHHLALHVTLVDGAISFTPQFFGSNPAEVLSGPHAGRRFLVAEQDLGFQLLHALEPAQLEVALVSPEAPDDILTRHDPVADASLLHRGLAYGDMNEDQRQLLSLLIGQYVGRAAGPIGLQTWQDITEQGVERLTFAWAGETQPGLGHRHYYSIAGPTFLAEYDNTQDNANHIHSVWRDLRNDWGTDLLANHYAMHR
ncbi:DUF3500 domain-containing protein [Kribbella speibonae]|uniref:DUF3500 domain-containing protein n=1 Tax=Kribbella speibonae TaxID=1572660 RepID=A0A4V2M4Z2_9ACTN|nr:DUF3500 domain-containing protein [Kribbella speibonae]TCC17030.1 DUF3500 domain-containing protein [Kribbella speibonae]TCC37842.1 DUF3500 domain-containing protein [Kribbella speibonae]